MPNPELRQALSVAIKRGRDWYNKSASMIRRYGCQGSFIVIGLFLQFYTSEPQSEGRCSAACCFPLILRQSVPEDRCRLETWKSVFQELKALRGEFNLLQGYTRDTPARLGEAVNITKRDGIIFSCDHHDRYGIADRNG